MCVSRTFDFPKHIPKHSSIYLTKQQFPCVMMEKNTMRNRHIFARKTDSFLMPNIGDRWLCMPQGVNIACR